jgi:2-haloacid dehalogenase
LRRYRDVLRGSAQAMGTDLAIQPTPAQLDAFADSLGSWPPFPDTVAALGRLGQRYKLAILSNVDDDLFARTAALLRVPFAAVITAQQVGSYKPSPANFRALLMRLDTTADRVLHAAQSLYHDHVPAKQLGFSTVWVNRASRLPGTGVALPAQAQPDLTVPDLASLSARLCP